MKKKAKIIINPISGTGKHESVVVAANKYINKGEWDYDFAFTEAPKHATELSKQAAKEDYNVVVAVGGDGTMHEVAKGLIGSSTALAIFPKGSGNGLARNMKIPMNLKKAIGVLQGWKTVKIDTVNINEDKFIGIAGIGFDAYVAYKFSEFGKRGLSSYVKIALSEYSKYQSQDIEIEIDGINVIKKAFVMSIANSSQFGNNAVVSPNASIYDGLVDICVMQKFPVYNAPAVATRLFTNTLDRSKYLEIMQGKSIVIKQKTDYVHLDGEPFKLGNELHVTVNPKSLNIVVPGFQTKNKSTLKKFANVIASETEK